MNKMGDWKRAIAVFREMKFPMNTESLEDKIIAQKTVCMLQLKGMDFNYPFGLYVRGSYSPAFTQDYYLHAKEFKELATDAAVSAEEKAMVNDLDAIFQKSASLLEIGVTYAYLVREMGKSPAEAFRIIKETKGFYRDTLIAKGISKAKEFLFEPEPEDLEWLREECGPMQEASLRSLRH